ncbi:MAG: hypothetical protein RLY58_2054, partial [Pseudomonadota bacterium]
SNVKYQCMLHAATPKKTNPWVRFFMRVSSNECRGRVLQMSFEGCQIGNNILALLAVV